MQRVTLAINDRLAEDFDAFVQARGYGNRSEAVRDVMRRALSDAHADTAEGYCVANLSYVYNHHERDMAARLTAMAHDHQVVVIASAHVHLDHDNCLETAMLRGPSAQVRAYADRVRAERGVRNGALNLIVVEPGHDHGHDHGGSGHSHAHDPHLAPR